MVDHLVLLSSFGHASLERSTLMALDWLLRHGAQSQAHFHYRKRRAPRRALPCVERFEDRCIPSTLTVNGLQTFQTISGFGTNLSSKAWNSGAVTPSLDILSSAMATSSFASSSSQ